MKPIQLTAWGLSLVALAAMPRAARAQDDATPRLSTGRIIVPSKGTETAVGSLPMNVAVTPDGQFAVVSDMGFRESLTVIRLSDGTQTFKMGFPVQVGSNGKGGFTFDKNGLYYGLAIVGNKTAPSDTTYASYTVYAAQGGNDSVAVVTLSTTGTLSPSTDKTATQGNLVGPLKGSTTDFDSTAPGSVITSFRKQSDATFAPGDTPAGLAVAGGKLFVANNSPSVFFNAQLALGVLTGKLPTTTNYFEAGSVSVIDPATGGEINRYTFPPQVSPLPNYPFAIAATADGNRIYVTSQRDAVVYVLDTSKVSATVKPTLLGAIPVGAHPAGILLDEPNHRLYVSSATDDTISIIDTNTSGLIRRIPVRPQGALSLPGASPLGMALDPVRKRLYVALGDLNAVEVIDTVRLRPLGYFPAGWYPSSVAVSSDGNHVLVVNAKGTVNRYPNPGYQPYLFNDNTQYDLNLIEGTSNYLTVPTDRDLVASTNLVLRYSRVTPTTDAAPNRHPLAGLGIKIKHVFYVIKENRTYDQVLGDLPGGDGQKALALFGSPHFAQGTAALTTDDITPNLHTLAARFVLLDRFFVCSEASGDGWPWSTRSYANEYVIKGLPYNYSGRSSSSRYDFEGQNNGYPVGGFKPFDANNKLNSVLFPPTAFPNGAPPIPDIADGPNGGIWDAAKRTGVSYRNYGFGLTFGASVPNPGAAIPGQPPTLQVLPDNYPGPKGLQPEGHDLAGISDYDYRRFDGSFADSTGPSDTQHPFPTAKYGKHNAHSRIEEFQTEFAQMLAKDPDNGSGVPKFVMIRLMNDHTQGTSAGQPTPKASVADNDYGVGELVQTISANKAVWESSAIFVIEDDAQDGPDHVDAHRSPCYVISPYITNNAVDHHFYNTDSVLRTIELLLGIAPLSQYDATADPIGYTGSVSTGVWNSIPVNNRPYSALAPVADLFAQRNPAPGSVPPGSVAAHLLKLSNTLDFTHPDSADPAVLNQILWVSVKGDKVPMPAIQHNIIPVKQPATVAKGTKTKTAPMKKDDDD